MRLEKPEVTEKKSEAAEEKPCFEDLFKAEYQGLLRFAAVTLRTRGSRYVSVSGRAEEAVQEMFAFAWENRADLYASERPVGWLYRALFFKILEILREDRAWMKRVMKMSEHCGPSGESFHLKAELTSILSEEEYQLLKRLYLDGYTYTELCAAMGLKKSALAMRVKRIKERIMREYESD